jgi:hypothetical protein
MSLFQKIADVRKGLVRYPSQYANARTEHAELGPFASPEEVAVALDASSRLSENSRYALVRAIVAEHEKGAHPLWSSLLFVAFAPLLLQMRGRLGQPEDEDRDQRVLVAFLQAIRTVSAARTGMHIAVALRRRTQEALVLHHKKEKEEPQRVSFEDEEHSPYDVNALTYAELRAEAAWAKRRAERVAALSRSAREATVRPLPAKRSTAA